jgi:hypothetical protein
MDYEEAKNKKDNLIYLVGNPLLISLDNTITDIVVLPKEDILRGVYIESIKTDFPQWIVTGFDHEYVYKKMGLKITADGREWNDDLTLFALLKQSKNEGEISYKCNLLINLIYSKEIAIQDTEGL